MRENARSGSDWRPFHWLIAPVAGASTIYAFAPFGGWWLAPLTLGLLHRLWRGASWWRAAALGALFGVGLYGPGLQWLFGLLIDVDAGYQPSLLLVVGGIVALLALFPALAGLLFALARRGDGGGLGGALLFASCWTSAEWLRSWVMTGAPLLQIGYAFGDSPLAGFAPLGGVLTVTFAASLTGPLLFALLRTPPRRALLGGATALTVLWGGGALARHIEWTAPGAPPLPVRIVHGDLTQDDKARRYRVVDTAKRYLDYSESAPEGALVVWHESSIAQSFRGVYRHIEGRMRALAAVGIEVLLGGYVEEARGAYNVMLRGAEPRQRYVKRHLIPFGEYTPAIPWLVSWLRLPEVPMDALTAGPREQHPLILRGVRLAPSVCFESQFGELLREEGARSGVLVHVSDLSWFDESLAADHIHQTNRMRALEQAKPMIVSTNRGVTALIDAEGKTVLERRGAEGYLDAAVTPRHGATPYARAGDTPLMAATAGVLLLSFAGRRFERERP